MHIKLIRIITIMQEINLGFIIGKELDEASLETLDQRIGDIANIEKNLLRELIPENRAIDYYNGFLSAIQTSYHQIKLDDGDYRSNLLKFTSVIANEIRKYTNQEGEFVNHHNDIQYNDDERILKYAKIVADLSKMYELTPIKESFYGVNSREFFEGLFDGFLCTELLYQHDSSKQKVPESLDIISIILANEINNYKHMKKTLIKEI